MTPLRKYGQLVIYPVHPRLVHSLRQALYPSGTKDDPLDAELILEALSKHRDKLGPLPVETAATRCCLKRCRPRPRPWRRVCW